MLIEYLFTYPRRVDQLLHPHHPYKKDLPYRPIPLLVFSLGNREMLLDISTLQRVELYRSTMT